jgi:hypothetical protein
MEQLGAHLADVSSPTALSERHEERMALLRYFASVTPNSHGISW